MGKIPLGQIIYTFFDDYLKQQKGLSSASIKSYRDTIKLFLNFVSTNTRHKITNLTAEDLTSQQVLDFLKFIEDTRGNHISTRNQRLASLHTFFEYLSIRFPETLAETQRITGIQSKRTPPAETYFLERDEIKTIFSALPKSGSCALRDRVILMFLYNTGARVQEVADLKLTNLELGEHPRVSLHGKGDKWRLSPLWNSTVLLLKQLINGYGQDFKPDNPVFQSITGKALTRYGIYKIVIKHTECLKKKKTDGSPLSISPHIFRHTTAVHLLESGVEVNVIRGCGWDM